RFHAARTIDARGRLLTPGFVDSHTHVVFAGDRSGEFIQRAGGADYEQIAAAGGGIRASVRATRGASEDQLYEESLPRLQRMLRSGTTTVEIKSGYGLDLETELRMLRVARRLGETTPMRVVTTFMGAHEFPDDRRDDRQGYVDEVIESMLPAVAAEGLAEFCDVFCERGVFDPEQSTRILEAGKQLGLRPKVHADEMAATGGSEVAAAVGAISADHLMHTTDASIAALREAGVVATLLPGTTFFLGKESYAPARRMIEAGATVALATDRNPGSCTIESMLFIIGLACLRMGMTPAEAFRGATLHGARALGLDGQVGVIAPGASADLIIWEAPSETRLCYEFENRHRRTVVAGGQIITD
ncbi:MAG: imidazolonepropionase, partial [Planctomycetota bacterium]